MIIKMPFWNGGPTDIYPILGSLLGVDTAASSHEPPSTDLYTSYLNNNSSGAAALLERESFMQCKHCNRYYKSHQKLQEHVRKYCLKEKKYKCISCEYRSRRKDHVLRHAKRKHCVLYEASKHDEDSLYVVRTEEPESDEQLRFDECSGGGGVGGGAGLVNLINNAVSAGQNSGGEFNFDFGGRDLTITAVPILLESEEDDDDYDDE